MWLEESVNWSSTTQPCGAQVLLPKEEEGMLGRQNQVTVQDSACTHRSLVKTGSLVI